MMCLLEVVLWCTSIPKYNMEIRFAVFSYSKFGIAFTLGVYAFTLRRDTALVRGSAHYHKTEPPPDGYEVLKAAFFFKEASFKLLAW